MTIKQAIETHFPHKGTDLSNIHYIAVEKALHDFAVFHVMAALNAAKEQVDCEGDQDSDINEVYDLNNIK